MARWQTVKVGDVCIVERGGSPRPIDKYITTADDGVNWIKIGDTTDSMYITATEQKIIPEGMKKSCYVQAGDFLLSNSMSFGRPYILKINGCIHDGWLVLRDKDNLFDKRFLYYYLSAPSTYQKFKNLAVGGVVNNLNSEMVRNVSIPLPLLAEQKNIATLFDRISGLISLRKQQLTKLDELVKARFVEMFGDLEVNPNGFMAATLQMLIDQGYIIYHLDGNHGSDYPKSEEFTDTGIPYIGANCIKSGTIDFALAKHLPPERANQLRKGIAQNNDVLFAHNATVGPVTILKTQEPIVILSTSLTAYRCNTDKMNPYFLCAYMKSDGFIAQYSSDMKQTTRNQVPITAQKRYRFVVPPMKYQNEFASFVEIVDKSKLTIQQSLDKLEVLKKTMMQEYFG